MATDLTIVLASRSPRRVELLHRLVSDFIVMPADLDETPHPQEDPVAYVQRLDGKRGNVRCGWCRYNC